MNVNSHLQEEISLTHADFRSGFVALIGPPNAGKSTLLNALLGQKVSIVSPKAQTTRNLIRAVKTTDSAQIVFVDTPGFVAPEHRGALNKQLRRDVQQTRGEVEAIVLVLDAYRARKFDEYWKDSLKQLPNGDIPCIIVLNKMDLLPGREVLPLIQRISAALPAERKAQVEFVPISASKNSQLHVLLELIQKVLPVGPMLYPAETTATNSEEFLVSEMIREKVLQCLHQEIPFGAAVRIVGWEEDAAKPLVRISAEIIVERESQKGIAIGAKGAMMKSIGSMARRDIEAHLRSPVFLELRVVVIPNWTSSEAGLRKVGMFGTEE